jgi:Domain of unknown function (DUF4383)
MLKNKLLSIIQKLPYLLGIALVLVGLIGFLPYGHIALGIHAHHVTSFHNFIHLFTGMGLIYVTFTKSNFRTKYLTLMGLLYLLLIILGISLGGNIFNIIFAFRDDHILHFGIAILCFWFGYFPPFNTTKN